MAMLAARDRNVEEGAAPKPEVRCMWVSIADMHIEAQVLGISFSPGLVHFRKYFMAGSLFFVCSSTFPRVPLIVTAHFVQPRLV